MKNNVFLKVKEHVLDYMTLEDLKMYLEKGHTSQELVQDWFFVCYHDQAFRAINDFYWDEFDESRYINKDESRKYKNGECYVWTIYKHMVAMAIDKMAKNSK